MRGMALIMIHRGIGNRTICTEDGWTAQAILALSAYAGALLNVIAQKLPKSRQSLSRPGPLYFLRNLLVLLHQLAKSRIIGRAGVGATVPIVAIRVEQRPAAIRGALDDQLGMRIEAVAQPQRHSGGLLGVSLQRIAGVKTSLSSCAQLLDSTHHRLGR